ncbi:MAG: hypothetical protein AB7O81_27135 [Blastocatellales bacterium]
MTKTEKVKRLWEQGKSNADMCHELKMLPANVSRITKELEMQKRIRELEEEVEQLKQNV